jgi:hypothetical protein
MIDLNEVYLGTIAATNTPIIYDVGHGRASIDGRWIRFICTGGTIMPQSLPELNHCGAVYFFTTFTNMQCLLLYN